MRNLLIGIDPDCEKNGVAIINTETKELSLFDWDFFDLQDYFTLNKNNIKLVRVEASWLISHNWHAKAKGSAALNANIGSRTGANHQVGKMIVQMCKRSVIMVDEVRPLKKGWKTASGKISKKEFVDLTGWSGTASQEVRDAALLIWNFKTK
jgi:Holliday junction resolvasome RuvABC endonuclease subunit